MSLTQSDSLAPFIDHTLLKADITEDQIKALCLEAQDNNFFSVCIPSSFIPLAYDQLKKSSVKICTVVGFPLGHQATEVKVFETKYSIEHGAEEIDMVINISALKSGHLDKVKNDINEVVRSAQDKTVKVILETALLNEKEIEIASKISEDAGAHFVKTSTGFSTGGATLSDIQIMKKSISPNMKIKASGGIKTQEQAWSFIRSGVHRLGTSSGVALVNNQKTDEGSY